MPQIPVYEQRTIARGTAPDASTGTGAGLQALGQAISSIAADNERVRQFARQKDEEAAGVAANSDLAEAQAKWSEEFMLRRQGVTPGAENFTPTLLADFEKDATERLKRAQTPTARTYLKQRLDATRLSLQNQALGFEAQERVRFRGASLDSALDNRRKAAEFNPDEFGTLAAEQRAAVEASGLPLPIQQEKAQAAVENLAEASVRGLIRRDPYGALKDLKNEDSATLSVRALNADDLLRLRAEAQSEVNRREAEQRARRAEARAGLGDRQADALAAKSFGLPAQLPTRAEYVAAYGAEDGARRYGQASQMLSTYDVVASAVVLPPAEGVAMVAAFTPQKQEGAADQAQVFGAAARLYAEQRKAFEADPAGYLVRRDPQLRESFEAAFGEEPDPEAVAAYVGRARAAQAASGVEEPRLLPAGVEARLAASLAFNPAKPEARSQTLAALEQTWGRSFPTLLAEVAPKLDGQARVMTLMDPATAAQFDRATLAAKDTAEIVPKDDRDAVDEAITAAVGPLAATLVASPDRNERLREVIDAARIMALDKVSRGTSPRDAAQAAVAAIADTQYDYRGTLRVPKGVDPDAAEAGAAQILRAGLPGVELALPSVTGADRFRTPEEMRAAAAATIQRKGVWVTNEDASGAQLLVPRGDTFLPVLDAAGRPIVLDWEQITGAAAKAPIALTPARPSFMLPGPGLAD